MTPRPPAGARLRLLVLAPGEDGGAWRAAFLAADPTLEVRVWPEVGDRAQVDVAFAWKPPPGELARYPNLRAVYALGAGVDGLLSDPEFPRDLPLVRMVDPALGRLMTEYVTGAVLRHHCEWDRYALLQRDGVWERHARPFMSDRVVGVMGLGELGGRAALALAQAGFTVRGWASRSREIAGVRTFGGDRELDAFLSACEILVCLLPLTERTRGVLCAATFAALPRGAALVHVARGAHLVESDLIAALDAGQLRSATIDVFEREPLPPGHPFWTDPRILITPHVASITSRASAARTVVANLGGWMRGEPLRDVVDARRGY